MHQPSRYLWVILLLLVMLVGIACTDQSEPGDDLSAQNEGAGAAVTVETTSSIPPRPTAAAAVEADFRPDSPLHVAATDRPQLIEFFAFW